MALVHIYRLVPRGPFHFGERGVGVEATAETFRSDALFSALCAVVREAEGTAGLELLLDGFREGDEPPFRITSCFPYAGDTLFFPRPMLALGSDVSPEAAKRLKGTRFVSAALLARWLAGEDLSAETAEGRNFLSECGAWVSGAERERLGALLAGPAGEPERRAPWWRYQVPGVTVDRQTNASAVYRRGRLAFRADCGLYFLATWHDEGYRSLIEGALAVLGDAGLGGRRSTGHGQFRPLAPEPLDLPTPAEPDATITLALYWPTPAELAAGVLAEPARYDLVARYGWLASPEAGALRRREVRMVAEGSLLAGAGTARGGLADVTPAGFDAHRVYRYGYAFPLGARVPGGSRG